MTPSIRIPVTPPVTAELEYVYDAEVVAGGLTGTLAHPPLTVWVIRKGQAQVSFSGNLPSLSAARGEALFLPAIPRSHRIAPGSRLLSCRFHLRNATGPLHWKGARPFRRPQQDLGALIRAGEELASLSRQLFGSRPSHDRYPDAPHVPPTLSSACAWSRAFSHWLTLTLDVIGDAGWYPVLTAGARPLIGRLRDRISDQGWNPPCTATEVADAFGFSSPSHFSAWFHRQTGMSPLAYRKATSHVGA